MVRLELVKAVGQRCVLRIDGSLPQRLCQHNPPQCHAQHAFIAFDADLCGTAARERMRTVRGVAVRRNAYSLSLRPMASIRLPSTSRCRFGSRVSGGPLRDAIRSTSRRQTASTIAPPVSTGAQAG